MAAPLHPVVLDWLAVSSAALVSEPAPVPRREYLATLDLLIRGALTTPYAAAGLSFNPGDAGAGATAWRWAQRVNCGTAWLRPAFTRTANTTTVGAMPDTATYGEASGSSAADQILTPSPFAEGTATYPPGTKVGIGYGAEIAETSPAAAMDRLYEATAQMHPYTERFMGGYHAGCSVVPILATDLSALVGVWPSGALLLETGAELLEETGDTLDLE